MSALCALPARAIDPVEERVDLRYHHYTDANGVTDELGSLLLLKKIGTRFALRWEQTVDAVSGASRDLGKDLRGEVRPGDYDGVTGASPGAESRHATRLAVEYSDRLHAASVGAYHSREDDYYSMGQTFSLSRDLAEGLATVGVDATFYQDDFRPLGAFAGMGGRKRILSIDLRAGRILNPLAVVDCELSWLSQSGYLGHPYLPPVASDGSLVRESLPSRRRGLAASARGVQGYRLGYLLGSVSMAGRYYRDDWGLDAADADLRWTQRFSPTGSVRLRARGYGQTGTSFAGTPAPEQTYRTADVRLFPFRSLLLGAKVAAAFPEALEALAWWPDRWDMGYEWLVRNTRGDGLGAIESGAEPGTSGRPRLYQLYAPDRYYRQGTWSLGVGFDL